MNIDIFSRIYLMLSSYHYTLYYIFAELNINIYSRIWLLNPATEPNPNLVSLLNIFNKYTVQCTVYGVHCTEPAI